MHFFETSCSKKYARTMRGMSLLLALALPLLALIVLLLVSMMGLLAMGPLEIMQKLGIVFFLLNYTCVAMCIGSLFFFVGMVVKFWQRGNRKKPMVRLDEDGVYCASWGAQPLPWQSILQVVPTGRNQGHGINFIINPKDPKVIALLKGQGWFEKIETIFARLPGLFGKTTTRLPLLWVQTSWTPYELKAHLAAFLPAEKIAKDLVDGDTANSMLVKNWRTRLIVVSPFFIAYVMLFSI